MAAHLQVAPLTHHSLLIINLLCLNISMSIVQNHFHMEQAYLADAVDAGGGRERAYIVQMAGAWNGQAPELLSKRHIQHSASCVVEARLHMQGGASWGVWRLPSHEQPPYSAWGKARPAPPSTPATQTPLHPTRGAL